MKTLGLREILRTVVRTSSSELFDIALENVSADIPPDVGMGDLAFPIAFDLSKKIKLARNEKVAPRAIAEKLKPALEEIEGVSRVEVAGAGYLNVFFDRARFLSQFHIEAGAEFPSANAREPPLSKSMVEHTSINPNKAAHIGHVRNAVIGDSFANILRASGERVEVQNYIDNTGVQVADVVVGFVHLEHMTLEDVKALDLSLSEKTPFDYYCWDLYARVGLFYRNGDPESVPDLEKLKLRDEILRAIEEGNNSIAELADYIAIRNVERILDTMDRLGIRYDVLPRESEILHLHFWDRAFENMKRIGVIHLATEGKSKGCWVMPFESHTGTNEHEADKIIVRSNGSVTYTGKDIAYQLWKLGRLGLDFYYRLFRVYDDSHKTWITTGVPGTNGSDHSPASFGGGAKVYNVIDSRQSYTQEIVRRGVMAIVPEAGEGASNHLSYEMVALTPSACAELGIALSAEEKLRPHIDMSGRKGRGIKADDLIDRLEANALEEVEARHPNIGLEDKRTTAHAIAIGALRYFLLKFTRNSVIAFDFSEALSFEGETGPYCQYAAVRANSIFRRLDPSAISRAEELKRDIAQGGEARDNVNRMLEGEKGDDVWSLLTLAVRLDEVIKQAAAMAEPAVLTKYTFNLARSFSFFYHHHRITGEEDATRRSVLALIADITRRQLTRALMIMGITVPDRM